MHTKNFGTFLATESEHTFVKTGEIGSFRNAIGAIILNNKNEVLITQRRSDSQANSGLWEITFGRVDTGEGFTDALIREVREEVGVELDLKSIQVLSVMHFMRTLNEPEYNGVVFFCKIKEGETIKSLESEIADWKWIQIDEAIELVSDYTQPHLEFLREKLKLKNL